METTLVIPGTVAVPTGNRIEVVQRRGVADGGVVAVKDLSRGVSVRYGDVPREEVDVWRAVVRECVISDGDRGAFTTLLVSSNDPAQEALDALDDADAAAAAAKAESDRWGGADRQPPTVPERFW